jgi:hypothetical protein
MYTLTGLEQGQTGGDCSGWEKDPESFSKRVADHYVRTVLKLGITVKRIYPHYSTGKDIMDVDFTDELTVAVSFRGIPNWVMAMRLRHQPAGPPRWYSYSCTAKGDLVLAEIPKPY